MNNTDQSNNEEKDNNNDASDIHRQWLNYFESLAKQLSGKLINARPQVRNSGGRLSYFVDIEIDGQQRALYLRAGRDMVPDKMALAELKKEKTVMDWLTARDVPIANSVALSDEPVGLTMEALSGDDDFLKISASPEGAETLDHYIDILATMHSYDVSALKEAGFYYPEGDFEIAYHHFRDFAIARYNAGGTPKNPLCSWSADWMARHAPQPSGDVCLVQGDTGPGNFVFANGKVEGLVDWELAHLGDAMEDLGVLRLRDVWTPFPGGFNRYLKRYSELSNRKIDLHAIRWYSIKLCIVHPHVLSIPFYYPSVSATPAEWVAEYYSLSRLGLEEIAIVEGIQLETPTMPEPRKSLQSDYHDELSKALREEVIANIDDDYHRYRAEQAWRTAQYLRGTERYLAAIEADEIIAINALTGYIAKDYQSAIDNLNQFVDKAGPEADEALLRFFYLQQWRKEQMMTGAIGRRRRGELFRPDYMT